MKPLMLMRKRGLFGTFFGKHAGCSKLSKSVGAFYDVSGAGAILKPLAGWTGAMGCQQSAAEIAIDDMDGVYVNNWTFSNFSQGYYGIGYHHFNDGTNTGGSCTFPLRMNTTADYEVYAHWTEGAGRATGAIYTINHVNGSDDITVDQSINGSQFNLLGVFTLDLLSSIVLKSSDTGAAIADAVKTVRV